MYKRQDQLTARTAAGEQAFAYYQLLTTGKRTEAVTRFGELDQAQLRRDVSQIALALSALLLIAGLAASLVVWGIGAFAYWLVMLSFHLGLSPATAVFMICAVAFAAILPSTPGYLGVFQWAVVWSLDVAAGVPGDDALAYALVVHAATIAVLLVLGPIGLRMLGLSSGDLRQRVLSQTRFEPGDVTPSRPH